MKGRRAKGAIFVAALTACVAMFGGIGAAQAAGPPIYSLFVGVTPGGIPGQFILSGTFTNIPDAGPALTNVTAQLQLGPGGLTFSGPNPQGPQFVPDGGLMFFTWTVNVPCGASSFFDVFVNFDGNPDPGNSHTGQLPLNGPPGPCGPPPPPPPHHLHVDIDGNGTVTDIGAGGGPSGTRINCLPDCDEDTGSNMHLQPNPAPGWTFANWTGSPCTLVEPPGSPACGLDMSADRTVIAHFVAVAPLYSFHITPTPGPGLGQTTLPAAFTNELGGVATLHNLSAQLQLGPGLSLVSGANPMTLPSLGDGATWGFSWVINVGCGPESFFDVFLNFTENPEGPGPKQFHFTMPRPPCSPLNPPPPEVTVEHVFTTPDGLPLVFSGTPTTFSKDVVGHCTGKKPVKAVKLVLDPDTGANVVLFLDHTGPGEVWSKVVTLGLVHGLTSLSFFVTCNDDSVETQDGGHIFIDPSGTVVNACTHAPIAGAKVTLQQKVAGLYLNAAAGSYIPAVNPQITAPDGVYQWFVIPGTWRVEATAPGFNVVDSPDLNIPPEVVGLVLALTPVGGCDTTPPVIQFHADVHVVTNDPHATGANVGYFPPDVIDNVDRTHPAFCEPGPGFFLLGQTHVVCHAQDLAGNLAADSFFDVFVDFVDNTPPLIACPAPLTAEANQLGGAFIVPPSALASDDSGFVTVTGPSAGSYPLGTTVTAYSATDGSGNSASCSSSITVVDTLPPQIAFHGAVNAVTNDAHATGTNVAYDEPTAGDVADGRPAVHCDPLPGSFFLLGTTPVHCTAHDASGNASDSFFDVFVDFVDNTAPTITDHDPVHVITHNAAATGAIVSYTAPTATDDHDASVAVQCAPASGSAFGLTHTLVHCHAEDAAGNSAESFFDVFVEFVDNRAPVIALHAGVHVTTTNPGGTNVSYALPTATDDHDASVTVTCGPISGSLFAVGHNTVTCNADDAAHNHATPTFFDVFVELVAAPDTTPPVIAPHADVIVLTANFTGASVSYSPPIVTDSGTPIGLATCAPPSGHFPLGTTLVTCHAQDAAGNHAADTSFRVFVTIDVIPALRALSASIDSSAVKNGLQNDLTNKLKETIDQLTKKKPNLKDACNKLDDFLKKLNEKTGKDGLTAAQATIWRNWATAISNAAGC